MQAKPAATDEKGNQLTMETVIVIPARYHSTRLPAKPLLRESGQYLIEHVYRAACGSKLADQVIVATDDSRIYDAVLSFNGRVEMTGGHHQSGSDRVAEVAARSPGEIFVNLQGDEPEINPDAIDQVIVLLREHPEDSVATLATRVSAEEAENPNLVKVVCDMSGRAMYFSRAKIPYAADPRRASGYLGHVGIYGYRRDFLLKYTSLPHSSLEDSEKLEQLRILENGYPITVGITCYRSQGIDTAEDYRKFLGRLGSKK